MRRPPDAQPNSPADADPGNTPHSPHIAPAADRILEASQSQRVREWGCWSSWLIAIASECSKGMASAVWRK